MDYDRFWMVIHIDGAVDQIGGGQKIPEKQAPKFMHADRERAEKELLRLSEKYPFSEFVLLESVAKVRQTMKRIFTVEPIDEIPF